MPHPDPANSIGATHVGAIRLRNSRSKAARRLRYTTGGIAAWHYEACPTDTPSMRLYLISAGLIVAIAMIALGLQPFMSDAAAPTALSKEDAALLLIAGCSMLLGALITHRRAGIAAILELLAGAMMVVAAGQGQAYLLVYAAAALVLGAGCMIVAIPGRIRASGAVPLPASTESGDDVVAPDPERIWTRVRTCRNRQAARIARRHERLRRNHAHGRRHDRPRDGNSTSHKQPGGIAPGAAARHTPVIPQSLIPERGE
jgi:hypothetical protein